MKHKELDPLDNIRSIAKVYGVDIDGLIEQKYQQGRADEYNRIMCIVAQNIGKYVYNVTEGKQLLDAIKTELEESEDKNGENT